jgi:hypothetical protein
LGLGYLGLGSKVVILLSRPDGTLGDPLTLDFVSLDRQDSYPDLTFGWIEVADYDGDGLADLLYTEATQRGKVVAVHNESD